MEESGSSDKVKAATGPVKAKANLDDMLGNLQEDMDKQGVKTTPKGVCWACQKPVVGQMITALGKTWHPEARVLKCHRAVRARLT